VVVYANPQEILAGPNIDRDATAWWTHRSVSRLSRSALHLHALLIQMPELRSAPAYAECQPIPELSFGFGLWQALAEKNAEESYSERSPGTTRSQSFALTARLASATVPKFLGPLVSNNVSILSGLFATPPD
jgi:hypothetical protein